MANRPPSLRYSEPRRDDYDRAYDLGRRGNVEVKIRRSARWQKLRLIKLARNPLCETCLVEGQITAAVEVDHIRPIARDPDLAYSMLNLMSLCRSCHARKTATERR